MKLLHRLTQVSIATLVINRAIAVAQYPSQRANDAHTIEPRMSVILQANAEISQMRGVKDTIAFIDNLHSASPCTQIASSNLVTDCQLLENPSEFAKVYPEQVLDDIRNEYALKLAICEYVGAQGAHPIPPAKCHAFYPSKEACVKRSWPWGRMEAHSDELCYPKTTKTELSQCLTSMQSEGQTWTSYSNARSRAMHICHLSRHHIEKEEALHLYKNLTLVVSKLHESVQPLESKLRAMEDQLLTWSDDTRQFFGESQEAAEKFTQFAKDARSEYQVQLKETSQSLRDIRSEHQVQLKETSQSLRDMKAQIDASFATGIELVQHNQANTLARFTKEMGLVYESLNEELSGQLEKYNTALQQYHENNVAVVRQQHATHVHSVHMLQLGIESASSSADTLRGELNSTIRHIKTVNEGLGSLVSIAQAARQYMVSFKTLFGYIGIGGTVLGLLLFAYCVSGVPLVGMAFRKATVAIMALLLSGMSCYVVSRSFSPLDSFMILNGAIVKIRSEWSYFSILIVAWVSLFSLFYYILRGTSIFSKILSGHHGPSGSQPSISLQEFPTAGPTSTTQLPAWATDSLLSHSSLPMNTTNIRVQRLRRGTQQELRDRINNFQRAATVC